MSRFILINTRTRRAFYLALALLASVTMVHLWPSAPRSQVYLGDLQPKFSLGPVLGPVAMLGRYESTPFLTTGWRPLTGDDFRTAAGSDSGAWIRFYLTHKVPLGLQLEGQAEKDSMKVRVALKDGQVLQELKLDREWSSFRCEVPQAALSEGLNQLAILAEGPTHWRACHLNPLQATGKLGSASTRERLELPFGQEIQIPALIEPQTWLVFDDVEPLIEPGAPSLQMPWDLTLRLQSGQGVDLSWHFGRGGPQKIPINAPAPPSQVTLSLFATCSGKIVAGQNGLILRNARLESWSSPPATSASPLVSLPAPPSSTSRPNIVLYVVDTLRADHLRCYGYATAATPNFDALALQGVRFADCAAQSSWTKASMASIMTSLLPQQHGAQDFPDILADSHETLARILAGAGFETHGIVANPFVTRAYGFAQGFSGYQELLNADAHQLTSESGAWLARRESKKPFFLYVHVLDPHLPYSPPARFRTGDGPPAFTLEDMKALREAREGLRPEKPSRVAASLGHALALYDGEIASCDEAFGKLVEQLKARDLYDNTIIIVVSDHGEQFFEHNLCDHMNSLYQELMHVPLIIKFPHSQGEGHVVQSVWQHIDIGPTLLRAVGVAVPATMQGIAYVPGGPVGKPDRPAYFSLHVGSQSAHYGQGEGFARADMDGLRIGPWIFTQATATVADVEPIQLFNLDKDPGQTHNLAYLRPEVRTWLAPLLRPTPKGNAVPRVSERLLHDSLRSLQYLR